MLLGLTTTALTSIQTMFLQSPPLLQSKLLRVPQQPDLLVMRRPAKLSSTASPSNRPVGASSAKIVRHQTACCICLQGEFPIARRNPFYVSVPKSISATKPPHKPKLQPRPNFTRSRPGPRGIARPYKPKTSRMHPLNKNMSLTNGRKPYQSVLYLSEYVSAILINITGRAGK